MSLDLELIKKNYEKFEDYKLEHLAKNEAGSLEPEVIPILMAEIKKRGLDPNLEKGIEAQTKEITESEIIEILDKVSGLKCPECGGKSNPLKGSLIRSVKSFIIFTNYKKTPIISCQECANKKRKSALTSTIILGWWGIPWGIIRTPQTIINYFVDKNKLKEISESILTGFVIENIGEIRTNWESEDELVEFIDHQNKLN
ncbi:hypothetical protein [Saccharicrinis aurantiacus]|uniref:hypothetical protein n=1 Tax=Saccharicrinis aurantiacus TaxID=1849719 RepID=UPI002491B719|nr:hypothetical protein [Saccharicrinis aurantiacus]